MMLGLFNDSHDEPGEGNIFLKNSAKPSPKASPRKEKEVPYFGSNDKFLKTSPRKHSSSVMDKDLRLPLSRVRDDSFTFSSDEETSGYTKKKTSPDDIPSRRKSRFFKDTDELSQRSRDSSTNQEHSHRSSLFGTPRSKSRNFELDDSFSFPKLKSKKEATDAKSEVLSSKYSAQRNASLENFTKNKDSKEDDDIDILLGLKESPKSGEKFSSSGVDSTSQKSSARQRRLSKQKLNSNVEKENELIKGKGKNEYIVDNDDLFGDERKRQQEKGASHKRYNLKQENGGGHKKRLLHEQSDEEKEEKEFQEIYKKTLNREETPTVMDEKANMDLDASSVCQEVRRNLHDQSLTMDTNPLIINKNQTSVHIQADRVIDKVSRDANVKYRHPDRKTATSGLVIPLTKYNAKPKIQTRLVVSSVKSQRSVDVQEAESSDALRASVCAAWYKDRTQMLKQRKKEEEERVRMEKEKKQKDLEEKRTNSALAFNAFVQSRGKQWVKGKVAKMKYEEKEVQKKEEETFKKKKEAAKNFTVWKETKDEVLKNKVKCMKEHVKESTSMKETLKKQKEKESEGALAAWKRKKENKFLVEKKKKEEEEKLRKLQEQIASNENRNAAVKSYEDWLRKKEERDALQKATLGRNRFLSLQHLSQSVLPFYPSGRTVALGR